MLRNVRICFAGVRLTVKHQALSGPTLREFRAYCAENEAFKKDVAELGDRVHAFASKFAMPGFEHY